MSVKSFGFSKNNDAEAVIITLKNKSGAAFSVTNYGATLVSLLVPDRNGEFVDVVCGYDSVEGYEKNWGYLGATVGRVAGRIDKAKFVLNGKEYAVDDNDNGQCLHGGYNGYDKRLWSYQILEEKSEVVFYLTSPDGDQGMPGTVYITASYSLTDDNELKIHYGAFADADTPISIINHAYWNLSGHASGDCLDQTVMINADFTNAINEKVCPTGEIVSVEGTAFDFRSPKAIGERIGNTDDILIKNAGGYDGNHIINGYTGEMRVVATAFSGKTGISMEVSSDQPGMTFYTSNFVDGYTGGKGGVTYQKYCGFCMECQHYPNSIGNTHFPSVIIRKGELYSSDSVFKFTVEK